MIYVDKLICYDYGPACFRSGACHMIADNQTELHVFAARLGLKRTWFQCPPKASIPHYDLTTSKRALAVQLGAIELDRRGFVAKMQFLRSQGWPA